MLNAALFLDRDGVINHDYGYVHKLEDFDFIEGIFDVARHACQKRYKLVVVTNQAGIARGYYTERQFHQLTDWMAQKFLEAGAPIDRVYFSPYHPVAGIGRYRKDDVSRKPRSGMILQAQNELSLDLAHSILIGDSSSDIKAGSLAGVGKNLLLAAAEPTDLRGMNYELIATLREAIPYLLGIHK